MTAKQAIWNCVDGFFGKPLDKTPKELLDVKQAIAYLKVEIDKLMHERSVYHAEMDKYFHALRLAVEDMETLKPKGKMCVMSVLDEETAAHCSGQGDCDDCLFWHYTKRAMAHIECLEQNAVKDEIEGRKRMDVEDMAKEMKG